MDKERLLNKRDLYKKIRQIIIDYSSDKNGKIDSVLLEDAIDCLSGVIIENLLSIILVIDENCEKTESTEQLYEFFDTSVQQFHDHFYDIIKSKIKQKKEKNDE